MNIVLYDSNERSRLFPLTLNKAIADLRFGILTIKERWEKITKQTVYVLTDSFLQPLYDAAPAGEYLFVDAAIIPSNDILIRLNELKDGEGLKDKNGTIAVRGQLMSIEEIRAIDNNLEETGEVKRLQSPHHLFVLNEEMIRFDFQLLTKGRRSEDLNETVTEIKTSQIFVEEGTDINHCIINASTGPVYIGKNVTLMEGCFLRGPVAIGEGAVVKMGTKLYGGTTIGPYCVAGGEIKNSILSGYSNKAHDGYLGDSIVGEWCNIGAGTSNSNIKNTGGEVGIWNYHDRKNIAAGIKCGVIMGDYSRTAINTSVNTGTVIGLCSNVFGSGLTPKFIPDFSWGFTEMVTYNFDKAVKDISNWKKMKHKTIDEKEATVLKHIFEEITTAFI